MQILTDLSSLESRIEVSKRLADADQKKIERFRNGSWRVSKAYVEGLLFVQILCGPIYLELKVGGVSGGVGYKHLGGGGLDSDKSTMLVWVGDGSQRFRPFDSLVRLQRLDCADVIVVKATKVSVPSPFVKDLWLVLNGKLGSALNLPTIEQGQLKDEIVEACAEIMNAIANGQAQYGWNDERIVNSYIQVLRKTRVLLYDNFVLLGLPKPAEEFFKFIEVFACPFYPEGSPFERRV